MSKNRNYSYFIVKPDGIRFFDRIHDRLSQEFGQVNYFYIPDYKQITNFVYSKHYKEKGEGFAKGYESYLNSLTSLFGNHARLAIVSSKADEEPFESLKQRVFDTKQALRQELIDPNVALLSNTPSNEEKKFRVRIIDEEGTERKQRTFTKPGNYRINKLDVIHSPDLEEESTREEIRMLIKSEVINYTNLIDDESLKEIIKFKSLAGFEGNKVYKRKLEEEQGR